MADALLVSDQYFDGGEISADDSSAFPSESGFGFGQRRKGQHSGFHSSPFSAFPAVFELDPRPNQSSDISAESKPIGRSFRRGHRISALHVLEKLAARQRGQQQKLRLRDEMEWIANNRSRFAGQWVALLGGNLLATGTSAREVFEAAKGAIATPLIVYVEAGSSPFIGW